MGRPVTPLVRRGVAARLARLACVVGVAWLVGGAWIGRAAAASTGAGLYVNQRPVPVVASAVDIDVRLGVAHGTVTQRFHNDRADAVEAIYVFPLPPGATVEAMTASVGGATIRGVIARRAEAAAAYQDAVGAGRAAALTEVERPGVFTQSLAPVPAGGEVVITLRWRAPLTRRDGAWELVHPLVVGPRYVPGAATGKPTRGVGTAVDTDRAPDASRLAPPTGVGAATPYRLTVALDDATAVTSPTHPVGVAAAGAGAAVTMADARGDREFVLRWQSRAAEQVRAIVEPAGGGAYVAVLVEPGAVVAPAPRTARAWIVLVDRSPSLAGAAAATARLVARGLVDAAPPGDAAAVVALGETPPRPGPIDRAASHAVIDGLPVGSADLTRALAQTLARVARDPAPEIVLITDGLVADDAAAIERAAAAGLRVHTIGIGAAPNRWLLGAIAARTGGTTAVVAGPDDVAAAVADVIGSDRALPVSVDWRTPAVIDTERSAPRIAAGGAALLVAVDPGGVPTGEVEIAIGPRKLRATLVRAPGAGLAATWAALRVERLFAHGDREAATQLALERGIVMPTTALLASTTRADEPVRSVIAVPVPAPAGTRQGAVREEQWRGPTTVDTVTVTNGRAGAAPPPPTGGTTGATRLDGDFGGDAAGGTGGEAGAPAPTAAPAIDAEDEADAEAPRAYQATLGSAEADDALGRALERRFWVASLGLGLRLDERVPAAQLSVGRYWRLPRFYAVGLRLDLTGAPLDAAAFGAAALASLTTANQLPVRLDVGAGLGWSDGWAAAWNAGLLFGRHGVGLAVRASGLAGPGAHTLTLSVGAEAAF